MRNEFSKIVLVAGILFALAFTFSCSGSNDPEGGGGDGSYYDPNREDTL